VKCRPVRDDGVKVLPQLLLTLLVVRYFRVTLQGEIATSKPSMVIAAVQEETRMQGTPGT
jgi:hypothetical protein